LGSENFFAAGERLSGSRGSWNRKKGHKSRNVPLFPLFGPDASFSDLQGFEPDGFGELVEPLLMARGHEIRIVD